MNRTRLGREYSTAAFRRVGSQQITIPAGETLDLTPYVPLAEDIHPAPYVRLVASANIGDNTGMLIGTLTENPVPVYADMNPTHPFRGVKQIDSIVAMAAHLQSPLGGGEFVILPPRVSATDLASANGDPQRFYITNWDEQADYDVWITFEVPVIGAKPGELQTRDQTYIESYYSRRHYRQIQEGFVELAADDSIDITALLPDESLCRDLGAKSMNLFVMIDFEQPGFITDPMVAISDDPATDIDQQAAYGPSVLLGGAPIVEGDNDTCFVVIPGLLPQSDNTAGQIVDGTTVHIVNRAPATVCQWAAFVTVPDLSWE